MPRKNKALPHVPPKNPRTWKLKNRAKRAARKAARQHAKGWQEWATSGKPSHRKPLTGPIEF